MAIRVWFIDGNVIAWEYRDPDLMHPLNASFYGGEGGRREVDLLSWNGRGMNDNLGT